MRNKRLSICAYLGYKETDDHSNICVCICLYLQLGYKEIYEHNHMCVCVLNLVTRKYMNIAIYMCT